MVELLVATENPGKLHEVRAILDVLSVEWLTLRPEWAAALPDEGDDYEANARAKALAGAAASGRVAVGDDSGLEVEALHGAPGPRSARYGGPGLDDAGRNAHLLGALRGVGPDARGARFVCVAAVATPEGGCAVARGECEGAILDAPRGREGFGYDPLFWVRERSCTMAELAPSEKHALSHRGRAFRSLRPEIERLLAAS